MYNLISVDHYAYMYQRMYAATHDTQVLESSLTREKAKASAEEENSTNRQGRNDGRLYLWSKV